ncbi:ABC transporter permease [Actinoallomurus iriomotensis]|uniref:ABC transporter permease n=1 Tax=Actinoallomurus iriomotensis TaxID=478107 RepID=A0A9W6W616_9ACTN|nr:ABC transporter permease [Actinoallomurus iriomotensis]GLY76371.1 ABC transporter permease [Actinoallomurus iriomotensis]GLY91567.1 ABC transporter permease [Actinoallomurus iriomotensis]
MVNFLIRRLLAAIALLIIVSMVTFAIFFLVPRLTGASSADLASRYVGKSAGPQAIHEVEIRLGLNRPVVVQYWNFVKGIIVGAHYDFGPSKVYCAPPCFGYSFINQTPVWPDLLDRLPVTLSLAAGAAVIWLVFGVTTGVISALKRGSAVDRASMGVALAGVSLPIFFTGLLSLAIFRDNLQWFPGAGTYVGFTQNPATWAANLVLPWVTLAFMQGALYARLTRAGMLETMGEDYIRTARAKGLPERVVITRHALRATLTPVLTIFGIDLGTLLGGAVLTEGTFSLPGLGKFAIDSINNNDLPRVLGVVMIGAFFIVLANLVVDILYAVIDPRVRLS